MDFKEIFVDVNTEANNYWKSRVNEILDQFPLAKRTNVRSHWNIPFFRSISPNQWNKSKRDYLVLGVLKSLKPWESNRSTEFIMGAANGCLSSCLYCYVNRRKENANPLTVYINDDQIIDTIIAHSEKLGPKITPSQCDPKWWTYDIGCNSDVSLDVNINDTPLKIISAMANSNYAKASFATKTVNPIWKTVDPKQRTRIRYSLMPQRISRLVDIKTSSISARIQDINGLVEAGYEVHLNFSPVILYSPFQLWLNEWLELLTEINDTLNEKSKKQLKCEVIFLTHSKQAHEINKQWHPKGEEILWAPDKQQEKYNKPGTICYEYGLKRKCVQYFSDLIEKHLPYCQIRYAF